MILPTIPTHCNACKQPLLLTNLYVDDGCPCNSARGVNLPPQVCGLCKIDNCVKPAHIGLDYTVSYWQEEARRYAANADYWRKRAEEAEAPCPGKKRGEYNGPG